MSVPRIGTRFDPEVSHLLERLAARAWPAQETEEVEGWLLRRTVGVARRRCKSLLPPADPGHAARSADLALAIAEELDFAAAVQVSPAEGHLRLDETLRDRGMPVSGPSLVLAGPLRSPTRGNQPVPRATAHVALSELDREWVGAWAAVTDMSGTGETADRVLSQLGDGARFATAFDGATGAPVAVGIGVVEEGWLGLFSLATTASARRRGFASSVVENLGAWAAARGAGGVYLQVEADNAGALAFYARRGFHIAHSYHYRSA